MVIGTVKEMMEEEEKKKNQRNIWKELKIPIMMILLIVVVLLFRAVIPFGNRIQRQTLPLANDSQQETEAKTEEATSSPTTQEYPVDTVNDGVYTNYEYGFRFEYPNDIFIGMGKIFTEGSLNDSVYWDNSNNPSSPLALGDDGVWLSLVIRRQHDSSDPTYESRHNKMFEDLYGFDTNIDPRMIVTNIVAKDMGDYRYLTYDFKNSPDYEGESSVAYKLLVKNDHQPVIGISLGASTQEILNLYKVEFSNIVDSFEFIK